MKSACEQLPELTLPESLCDKERCCVICHDIAEWMTCAQLAKRLHPNLTPGESLCDRDKCCVTCYDIAEPGTLAWPIKVSFLFVSRKEDQARRTRALSSLSLATVQVEKHRANLFTSTMGRCRTLSSSRISAWMSREKLLSWDMGKYFEEIR